MQFNDVPLRTRMLLTLYKVYGKSALLVLNGILLHIINALLVLNGIVLHIINALLVLSWQYVERPEENTQLDIKKF